MGARPKRSSTKSIRSKSYDFLVPISVREKEKFRSLFTIACWNFDVSFESFGGFVTGLENALTHDCRAKYSVVVAWSGYILLTSRETHDPSINKSRRLDMTSVLPRVHVYKIGGECSYAT